MQDSVKKKILFRLIIMDIFAIIVTLAYFYYLNYAPIVLNCPNSPSYINGTALLQKVDFAEHGQYSLSGCVSSSIQYSQAVYNKYNISVNVTDLRKLIEYRAFWQRSLWTMLLLSVEFIIAILLFIYRKIHL